MGYLIPELVTPIEKSTLLPQTFSAKNLRILQSETPNSSNTEGSKISSTPTLSSSKVADEEVTSFDQELTKIWKYVTVEGNSNHLDLEKFNDNGYPVVYSKALNLAISFLLMILNAYLLA